MKENSSIKSHQVKWSCDNYNHNNKIEWIWRPNQKGASKIQNNLRRELFWENSYLKNIIVYCENSDFRSDKLCYIVYGFGTDRHTETQKSTRLKFA